MSASIVKTNPHVFYAEGEVPGAPGLSATHCRACGRHTLGRVPICSLCFSRDVEHVVAGRRGQLVEHSIAHHPAGGFKAPYAIGLVRTEEGMTLFAPLEGSVEGLAPGLPLYFVTVGRDGGAVGFAYTTQAGARRA